MSRNQSFFHGTSDHWASEIVNNGQRANMSRSSMYGRGLYLTQDPDEARSFAAGKSARSAVIEGNLHPGSRIYDLTPEDHDRLLDGIYEAGGMDRAEGLRASNKWTSEFSRQGYHVLRNPSTNYHIAIRPNVFLPSVVHYPEGSVNLR